MGGQIIINDDEPDRPELPGYGDPGSILVYISAKTDECPRDKWTYDVIDYSGSVFWLQEGQGIEYWLDTAVDFPHEGLFLITNVKGVYHRGNWSWGEDDSEDWDCDDPVPVSLNTTFPKD